MTPHQALTVAVRLFAILLALYGGRELLAITITGKGFGDDDVLPLAAAFALIVFATVVVLWFFPRSIARHLLPGSADTPAPPSPPDVWLSVGSCLIGLWLIADAVPAVFRNGFLMYAFWSDGRMERADLRYGLVYFGLQIAVGLLLILGANGIRRLIVWARYSGTDQDQR